MIEWKRIMNKIGKNRVLLFLKKKEDFDVKIKSKKVYRNTVITDYLLKNFKLLNKEGELYEIGW